MRPVLFLNHCERYKFNHQKSRRGCEWATNLRWPRWDAKDGFNNNNKRQKMHLNWLIPFNSSFKHRIWRCYCNRIDKKWYSRYVTALLVQTVCVPVWFHPVSFLLHPNWKWFEIIWFRARRAWLSSPSKYYAQRKKSSPQHRSVWLVTTYCTGIGGGSGGTKASLDLEGLQSQRKYLCLAFGEIGNCTLIGTLFVHESDRNISIGVVFRLENE